MRTDNCVAAALTGKKELVGVEARWNEQLVDFDLVFQTVKGTLNFVADALSRSPAVSDDIGQTTNKKGVNASCEVEIFDGPNLPSEGGAAPWTPSSSPVHGPEGRDVPETVRARDGVPFCELEEKNGRNVGIVESKSSKGEGIITAALVGPSRSLSREEICIRQSRDAALSEIILTLPRKNARGERFREKFAVIEGILYRRGDADAAGRLWKLALPRCLWLEVTKSCHGDAMAGHEGQSKTLERVQQRYWWPGMRDYVRGVVRRCAWCQVRRVDRVLPAGLLEPISPPTQPFELWGIDHMGPLTLTSAGNQYIIVAIDYFSKLVIAKALPSAKCCDAVNFFMDEVVRKYGAPPRLISDQGKAFIAREWAEMVSAIGTCHHLVSPEHAQGNGLVEKVNGTVINRLSAFVQEEPEAWDENLQSAVFSINTATQDSTGTSPFELLFGIAPRLPRENFFPWPEETRDRRERSMKAREKAASRLVKAQARQKRNYDKRRRKETPFEPGDLVLVKRKRKKKGIPRKFQPNYIGPFQILRRLTRGSYEVSDLPCNSTPNRCWIFTATPAQLRPFHLPRVEEDETEEDVANWSESDSEIAADERESEAESSLSPLSPSSVEPEAGESDISELEDEPAHSTPSQDTLLDAVGLPEEPAHSTTHRSTLLEPLEELDQTIETYGRPQRRNRRPPACFKDFVIGSP